MSIKWHRGVCKGIEGLNGAVKLIQSIEFSTVPYSCLICVHVRGAVYGLWSNFLAVHGFMVFSWDNSLAGEIKSTPDTRPVPLMSLICAKEIKTDWNKAFQSGQRVTGYVIIAINVTQFEGLIKLIFAREDNAAQLNYQSISNGPIRISWQFYISTCISLLSWGSGII